MKNYCMIALLLLTLPVAAADKVYKKVNPDGSVEYSDQPIEGSEEMSVDQAPATRFEKSPDINYQPPERDRADSSSYEVSITSPGNDESIRDNAGNVTLRGSVEPGLRGGHQLRWRLDGEPLAQSGATVSLTNMDRGTHTVKLEVVNNDGEVLGASSSVTFHLLRHSKKRPAPPSGSQPTPLNPPKPNIPGSTPTNPPKPSPPSSSP
ncbi:MAG: DUF4124 domain-containing protein [Thiohalophilus sp.]|uniref:DUF4124 domain-containing protein n=1 Tax=Thiohalophilus sp. TaxID=3028392 RepID=UPI00286FBA49|nr:DUF4124 domain-containing protein [Thiohalophilus sp.]MDR9437767.1 DUF4124 domain-containing protein [Thiohalophilus sp.]